jgi:hypothetical protein
MHEIVITSGIQHIYCYQNTASENESSTKRRLVTE